MKKNKRIISFALALVLMFSFMALSASAATVEVPVVQPKATCPQCGGYGYVLWSTDHRETEQSSYTSCANRSTPHKHSDVNVYNTNRCSTCGYTKTFYSYSYVSCPYGSL